MKKKLMFVLGTRPEAIKLAPLILLAQEDARFTVVVCSTGQHREMLQPLFELFKIRPHYDFELIKPGQTLHDITATVLEKMKVCVKKESPDWVIVQGDTTSAMAASLCAFYDKVAVAHVEAGLRTGDLLSPWPEEFNRRVIALTARLHFAPTPESADNLFREGISQVSVEITGNTGIDSLLKMNDTLKSEKNFQSQLASSFDFLNPSKKLLLVTLHRRESFGEPVRAIMKGLLRLARRADVELLIPLHMNPEVRGAAAEILGGHARWVGKENLSEKSSIWICEPLDYLSFIYAMNRCHFILTDSGGIQEEAPSLGKPVLVVRETTERPEAVKAGTSKLIGSREESVFDEANLLLDDEREFEKMARAHNPYGDGKASQRILHKLAQSSNVVGGPL